MLEDETVCQDRIAYPCLAGCKRRKQPANEVAACWSRCWDHAKTRCGFWLRLRRWIGVGT